MHSLYLPSRRVRLETELNELIPTSLDRAYADSDVDRTAKMLSSVQVVAAGRMPAACTKGLLMSVGNMHVSTGGGQYYGLSGSPVESLGF